MYTRRASLFVALLFTAALLCAMPGLLESLHAQDANRMDERLRPARSRTLTLWLLGDDVSDDPLLSELCALFEKQADGVRVFLRRVSPSETTEKNAVLPDVLLYITGSIVNPEQLFLPLSPAPRVPAEALLSGKSSGESYALPLWYAPSILSLPAGWLRQEGAPTATPRPQSFFDLGTPAPKLSKHDIPSTITADALPWRKLLQKNALVPPKGLALQQLLFSCPLSVRRELIDACTGNASMSTSAAASIASPKASPPSVDANASPPLPQAKVLTLAQYQLCAKANADLIACPLKPAASDAVRYLSLCRNGADARAFLHFVLSDTAQQAALSHHLLPVVPLAPSADPLTAELQACCQSGLLFPNAFAHARQELQALCMNAFLSASDPVETLLRLR
ncbi:MAG: hypothetical protein RSI33_11230 [Clostridia bacterium]